MKKCFLVLGLCLGCASCGSYSLLGGPGSSVPAHYRGVSVPGFENHSAETGLGSKCAAALQDRLSVDGQDASRNPKEADLVVYGAITEVHEDVLSFSRVRGADDVEIELEVVVEIRAFHRGGKQVYESGPMVGTRVFRASGTPAEINAERRIAAREACGEAVYWAGDELTTVLWEEPVQQSARQIVPVPASLEEKGDEPVEKPVGAPRPARLNLSDPR